MGIYDIEPLGLEKIRTYPLATRKSKASVRDFVKPHRRGATVAGFLDALPRGLAAADLRAALGPSSAAERAAGRCGGAWAGAVSGSGWSQGGGARSSGA